MPNVRGSSARPLLEIADAPAWPGFFPAYGKTPRQTSQLLAAAAQSLQSGAARESFSARRSGNAKAGIGAGIGAGAAAASNLLKTTAEIPRPVSNKKQPKPVEPNVDPELLKGLEPSFSTKDEKWRVQTETPSYDQEIADSANAFMERVLSLATNKGLSLEHENQLLDEARSYGLTMAQAMKLIHERFPRKAGERARKRQASVLDDDGPDPKPRRRPRGARPEGAPREPIIELDPHANDSSAKRFFRALVRQSPELFSRFIGWWVTILLGGTLFAFLGLNFIWRQVEHNSVPLKPTPAPVRATPAPTPTPLPPVAPEPPAINYLASTLRGQAQPKPDDMIDVDARFVEGGAYVAPFAMRACEVTVAEYADFVAATGHRTPLGWPEQKPPPGSMPFPVTGVSATDAEAFCQWKSYRDRLANAAYKLPDLRHYKALHREAGPPQRAGGVINEALPYPASVPGNDSTTYKGQQVLHLFGNAPEWVYDATASQAVAVGGAWFDANADFADATRIPGEQVPLSAIGFRYVRVRSP
jgi:hypothetical protein